MLRLTETRARRPDARRPDAVPNDPSCPPARRGIGRCGVGKSVTSALMLLALLFATPGRVAPIPPLPNLDFELGSSDGVPASWAVRDARLAGFGVTTSEVRPHSGRLCLEIRRDEISAASVSEVGRVARQIDAAPYRGHRVRLSGWARFIPLAGVPYGSARLWLRVNLPGDRVGYFDQMDGRPCRTEEWSFLSVVGEVAADADTILFGPGLETAGVMWADDLTLERLGPLGEGDERPRVLSGRALENLTAFANLLGYVRYFHPSEGAANTDWESFAIAGVSRVEDARSDIERRIALDIVHVRLRRREARGRGIGLLRDIVDDLL